MSLNSVKQLQHGDDPKLGIYLYALLSYKDVKKSKTYEFSIQIWCCCILR